MSSIVIKGDTSGQIEIAAPAVAGSTTLTLPTGSGDFITADSSGNVNIDSGTLYVDATNNRVGVGTSSPTNNLQIYNNGATSGQIHITNSSTGATATDGVLFGYDGSNDVLINNQEATAMKFNNNGSERMRIDSSGNLKFDSGYGSVATAYGCRAWVNFNGTGTVAIRDSGNVSSITDSGVGDYRVNFSTAMPDTDYAVVGSCQGVSGSDIVDFGSFGYGGAPSVTPTTSQVAVGAFAYSGASVDTPIVSVAVFR